MPPSFQVRYLSDRSSKLQKRQNLRKLDIYIFPTMSSLKKSKLPKTSKQQHGNMVGNG